jgi:ketosteroid isomerase-like protein
LIIMPTPETLERFISRVEENAHDAAVQEFYTENALTRENQEPPRIGRAAHVAREKKVLERARTVRSRCVRPVFVAGDHVVIRWIFEFGWRDGTVTRMEELACQRWEGEQIAEEQFFYDPAQRTPRQP